MELMFWGFRKQKQREVALELTYQYSEFIGVSFYKNINLILH